MSEEKPIVLNILRVVGYAIALVIVVVLVTLGYSAYQQVNYLLGDQASLGAFRANATHITLEGFALPNRGLYPLQISIDGQVSGDNQLIGEGHSGPYLIYPGGEETITFTLKIDGLKVKKVESLYLTLTVKAAIIPFAEVTITRSQSISVPLSVVTSTEYN